MANNKKRKKSSYQKPKSDFTPTHSKGTRIFVLVMALLMVIGLLVTMIAYIILTFVDPHDHDSESSSKPVVNVSSSDKSSSTVDSKPSTTTSSSTVTSSSNATADNSTLGSETIDSATVESK